MFSDPKILLFQQFSRTSALRWPEFQTPAKTVPQRIAIPRTARSCLASSNSTTMPSQPSRRPTAATMIDYAYQNYSIIAIANQCKSTMPQRHRNHRESMQAQNCPSIIANRAEPHRLNTNSTKASKRIVQHDHRCNAKVRRSSTIIIASPESLLQLRNSPPDYFCPSHVFGALHPSRAIDRFPARPNSTEKAAESPNTFT